MWEKSYIFGAPTTRANKNATASQEKDSGRKEKARQCLQWHYFLVLLTVDPRFPGAWALRVIQPALKWEKQKMMSKSNSKL